MTIGIYDVIFDMYIWLHGDMIARLRVERTLNDED